MASQKNRQSAPKARHNDLIVEKAGNETVVYDLERVRAHCLNESATEIWHLCDGKRTVEQIAERLPLDLNAASRATVVRDAIARLERLGLVEKTGWQNISISRRELARKIGIGIAASVALPVITSIVAPSPANAASCVKTGKSCLGVPCCAGHGTCCSSGSQINTCRHSCSA